MSSVYSSSYTQAFLEQIHDYNRGINYDHAPQRLAYSQGFLNNRYDKRLNCSPKSHQCGSACVPKAHKCASPTNSLSVSKVVETEENKIKDLPYETAVAINPKDGTVLFRKKGQQTSVFFSDEEVKKMKGAIVTHNHPNLGWDKSDPRSRGMTFSKQDLAAACAAEVKEMRAVSSGYRHSISAPKAEWNLEFYNKIVSPVYDKHFGAVYEELTTDIMNGKLTISEGEAQLHHETIRRTSRDLKLAYKRESVK